MALSALIFPTMPNAQSTPEEMLAYWKALSGDTSSYIWQPENMGMFFQCFRTRVPDVEAAFEGVVGANEILPRLLDVYAATAEGWQREESYDAYFIVRRPQPLTGERALELGEEYLQKIGEITAEFEEEDDEDAPAGALRAVLNQVQTLEVVHGAEEDAPDPGDSEGLVYEVINDYMHYLKWELQPVESHAHLMREALYTLACDYNLKYHVLWPLYRSLTPITEPFAAYFELWQHGACCRFHENGLVRIYVPNLVG